MKFLLDVHIGLQIARTLTEAGHDVMRAALECPTATDAELLGRAVAEHRILVTEDSDFTDLIFAHDVAAPPALIFIRCEPFEQPLIAHSLLEVVEDGRLQGRVAVVTSLQVRYRSFPKGKSTDG